MHSPISFVSTIPVRQKRPGKWLSTLALFLCFLVVAIGLLEGKGLLAAIGPVGVALSYFLIRVGGPSRTAINRPVQTELQADSQTVQIIYHAIDRADHRGLHDEVWTFQVAGLKPVICDSRQNVILLDGKGSLQYSGSAQPHLATCLALRIPDPEDCRQAARLLQTVVPVQIR